MKGRLFTESDVDMLLVFAFAGVAGSDARKPPRDFKEARELREEVVAQIEARAERVPTTEMRFTFDAQAADKWWHAMRQLALTAYHRGHTDGANDRTADEPERIVLSDGFEGGFPSDRLVEAYYARADRDAERAKDAEQ